jgi:type 1 glutamine amidotransferase
MTKDSLKIIFFISLFYVSVTGCKVHDRYIANPHIVFIAGDDEYRSEESMPMLAEILKREINAKVSFCFATDQDGFINPSAKSNITNLEALKTADLAVFFMRFRALPEDQLKLITDFVESGKPLVGFRTSTHAFLYENNESFKQMNNDWPAKVFGQQWITHHGHFDDGKFPLTDVFATDPNHIILTGVRSFKAYSWLYHVDGGAWKLSGDSKPFLSGKSLKSGHEMKGDLDKFPLTNPVAWTKTYTGSSKVAARVFFTTLGHPYDFKDENMRRLSINGILWALKRENSIKPGLNVTPVKEFVPNNSGMGNPYNKNVKPFNTL